MEEVTNPVEIKIDAEKVLTYDFISDKVKHLVTANMPELKYAEPKPEEPKALSVEEKIKSFTGKINGYKIKLKRASSEDAEKIAKKIKGYEIKLKGLAIKMKNGGTILEKGGGLGEKFKAGDYIFAKASRFNTKIKDESAKIPFFVSHWSHDKYYILGDGSHYISEGELTPATEKDFNDYYGDNASDGYKHILKDGGNAIEFTSSVQDPKPTGADELAFTHTSHDPEQMAKGGGLDNFSSHIDEWFDELVDYVRAEKEIDPNFDKLVAIAQLTATHENLARFAKIMEECSCGNKNFKETILEHIKSIQQNKYRKEFKHQYGGKGTGHGTSGKVSVASSFFDLFLQAAYYENQYEKGGGVGDSVHINDAEHQLNGKAGLVIGIHGKNYLLKVLDKGKEVDVTIPKSNTTPFPENID